MGKQAAGRQEGGKSGKAGKPAHCEPVSQDCRSLKLQNGKSVAGGET